jgi:hypothetical protein
MDFPETLQAVAVVHLGGPHLLFFTAAFSAGSCAEGS